MSSRRRPFPVRGGKMALMALLFDLLEFRQFDQIEAVAA
jgi:hypothetical protein